MNKKLVKAVDAIDMAIVDAYGNKENVILPPDTLQPVVRFMHKTFSQEIAYKPLTRPLTLKALKKVANKNGRISVNILVDLEDLITLDWGNIEGLNNLADEKVLDQDDVSGSLSDISYQVVGCVPGNGRGTVTGSVIINVNADVSDMLKEENE
jgi:hypothetical protein